MSILNCFMLFDSFYDLGRVPVVSPYKLDYEGFNSISSTFDLRNIESISHAKVM